MIFKIIVFTIILLLLPLALHSAFDIPYYSGAKTTTTSSIVITTISWNPLPVLTIPDIKTIPNLPQSCQVSNLTIVASKVYTDATSKSYIDGKDSQGNSIKCYYYNSVMPITPRNGQFFSVWGTPYSNATLAISGISLYKSSTNLNTPIETTIEKLYTPPLPPYCMILNSTVTAISTDVKSLVKSYVDISDGNGKTLRCWYWYKQFPYIPVINSKITVWGTPYSTPKLDLEGVCVSDIIL